MNNFDVRLYSTCTYSTCAVYSDAVLMWGRPRPTRAISLRPTPGDGVAIKARSLRALPLLRLTRGMSMGVKAVTGPLGDGRRRVPSLAVTIPTSSRLPKWAAADLFVCQGGGVGQVCDGTRQLL